jgi:hypothetical protein
MAERLHKRSEMEVSASLKEKLGQVSPTMEGGYWLVSGQTSLGFLVKGHVAVR